MLGMVGPRSTDLTPTHFLAECTFAGHTVSGTDRKHIAHDLKWVMDLALCNSAQPCLNRKKSSHKVRTMELTSSLLVLVKKILISAYRDILEMCLFLFRYDCATGSLVQHQCINLTNGLLEDVKKIHKHFSTLWKIDTCELKLPLLRRQFNPYVSQGR